MPCVARFFRIDNKIAVYILLSLPNEMYTAIKFCILTVGGFFDTLAPAADFQQPVLYATCIKSCILICQLSQIVLLLIDFWKESGIIMLLEYWVGSPLPVHGLYNE